MSFARRGKSFFSSTASAARKSAESIAAAARSSVGAVPTFAAFVDTDSVSGSPDAAGDGDVLRGRMAYIAVSRTQELLAEVADREVPEVEKDFAIALGRKMIKRGDLPGWDEISSGRHRAIKFSIHDLQGCTSYTICFSHTFPAERAQAFVQKLALMMDPVIEKSATITETLIESTILIILPVLERELERGNSGVKSYQIDNQKTEIKEIITQNVEIMLDRGGSNMIRTLDRFALTNQVKWGVGPGTKHPRSDDRWIEEELNEAAESNAPTTSTQPEPRRPAASASAPEPQKPGADVPPVPGFTAAAAYPATPKAPKATTPTAKPRQPAKAPAPAPPPKPQTPRTRARTLVGTKLSEEQAAKAAAIIMKLEPFVKGQKKASLDEIWTFLDVDKPFGNSYKEGDPTAKSLRGKMNRQRLLLHPDKNMHPDAEATFKFLEQCNQRLIDSCMRKAGGNESTAQRTRREEQDLRQEEQKRRKQEEEWEATQEKIRKEEEEKWRQENQKVQKAESDRQRYEKMLRDKENMLQNQAARVARARAPPTSSWPTSFLNADDPPLNEHEPPCALPSSQPLPAVQPGLPASDGTSGAGEPDPKELVGKLTLTVLNARDLPPGGFFSETNAYCMAGVGSQRTRTTSVPGVHPKWDCTFEFDLHMEDQGLYVTVWREGWGFSLLGDDFLGRIEIPFLDLDDWSGCVIGRVIEGADPDADSMVLELKASIEWV